MTTFREVTLYLGPRDGESVKVYDGALIYRTTGFKITNTNGEEHEQVKSTIGIYEQTTNPSIFIWSGYE